jgi:glucose-1-phosphate cytidylyltransferase
LGNIHFVQKKQKVVILAGGYGSRLFEETISVPKPLVEIQGHPLIWHNMNRFAKFGFTEFIICLGYKSGELISFFHSKAKEIHELSSGRKEMILFNDWKITLAETGEETMTGGRIKRVEDLLSDVFLLSYSDNLSDIHAGKLFDFFSASGKSCILTGVNPKLSYGIIHCDGEHVIGFSEKPLIEHMEINAGFFVCHPTILKYVEDDRSVFETDVLNQLIKQQDLGIYRHRGFWKSIDTYKDLCEAREMKNLLPLLDASF